ncbi:cytochrome p450 alkane monooxygenase [Grosmannia clavigera kw1407]|uniref:Cytochrome p450 alkane monooxygenase n=1 Tax=Grosmannia clavigera (strain kw1407 / UAMH 11150) TaxID=655863 RepID=F0XHG6_GROCL|nr:cytochrome p450 alkane monooxygenase [Grosmannia clavigera kw1407]EFX02953.1 cytochrome p450 alkane monooxygenase [Grosmannia clavigera kw1407]
MGLLDDSWSQLSWFAVLLWAIGGYTVVHVVRRQIERRRLHRTGGARTAMYRGKWPWGLDLAYRAVLAVVYHQNRELWENIFRSTGLHTAEFRVLGRRIIFTDDPENIKALLATQFGDYGKGEPFHREWKEFLGDSIFTTDGARWHASRQLIRPQFVKDRVSDLQIFESHLQTLFIAMSVGGDAAATAAALQSPASGPVSSSGRVLEMSDLFFRFTLDVATDFLLGTDIQSLTIPRQEFAEAFNEVQHMQSMISRTGPANIFVPRFAYRRGLKVMDKFLDLFIERALCLPVEELEKSTTGAAGRYTFLHELARFTRDRKVLRDQLIAVLLAGRDTTAGTLSWGIYELARHPECVQRLRAEIAEVVGVEGAQGTSCRLPTYADLKSMRYLQHVLNEILRMYPAVPYNVRLALHDTTLPRGGGPDGSLPVSILKDTPIGYSTLTMQRRGDLYPETQGHKASLRGPGTFCPERWDHWQPKPWHYIPFNGGPRICIGQQFALTEMGYVLVRLLQKFERIVSHMGPIDGGHPTLKADIVLQPGDGVHVAFFEAAKA